MAGEAGGDPRAWLTADETAAAFLSRSLSARPPVLLPPPLHRAPLRPGNIVEIAGPSNSGKSQLLLMAAVQCILPKEWEGVHFGGLGKAVVYLDLDCRFDVLRLSQILMHRIAEACGSTHPVNKEFEKDGAKEQLQYSFESVRFSECMKRFLYVRCYNSSEFIAALKTLYFHSPRRSEVFGVGIHFLMIDSISAFYWIDRVNHPVGESKGKTLSLQSTTETVVQEIRKLLQLQPALVLATKAHIYGGTAAINNLQRVSSKYFPEDLADLGSSRHEGERNFSCREFMPSAWQSFVTHRLQLQVSEGLSSGRESEMLFIRTAEWVQPPLKTKDKFCVRDDAQTAPSFISCNFSLNDQDGVSLIQ